MEEEEEEEAPNRHTDEGVHALVPSTRHRWLCHSVYCLCYIAIGAVTAMLGPTLVPLAEEAGRSVGSLAALFTSRGLGWFFGSVVAGKILDRFHGSGHRLLMVGLVLNTVSLFLVPILAKFFILVAIHLLVGVGCGLIDCVCNALAVWIWAPHVGPRLQLLHAAFGVGTFLAPLLVAPLLDLHHGLRLSYWCLAGGILPMALCPLIVHAPHQPPDTEERENKEEVTSSSRACLSSRQGIIGLVSIFLFLYVGCEVGFGGYIAAFAVKHHGFSESKASLLTSVVWGSFALGRFIGIPKSRALSPRTMLVMDIFVSISGILVLIVSPSSADAALWIGSGIVGFGMAAIFATAISLPTVFGLSVDGRDTSVLVSSAAGGELVMPLLIGALFHHLGPVALLWVNLGSFVFALLVFLSLETIWRRRTRNPKGHHRLREEVELSPI